MCVVEDVEGFLLMDKLPGMGCELPELTLVPAKLTNIK
jgi:hypothetical protein